MKKITNIASVFLVTVLMVSCTNGQNKSTDGAIAKNVNVEEFVGYMEGAQLLDVRTPGEWNEGVIEDATLMNFYEEDFKDRVAKLDKDKPVAVYCKSGGRSGQAMTMMRDMGFKEVYNLNGGIDAWNKAGKPTVKP